MRKKKLYSKKKETVGTRKEERGMGKLKSMEKHKVNSEKIRNSVKLYPGKGSL